MPRDLAAESYPTRVDQFQGLTRGCIIHAIDPADTAPLFDALENLCSMPPEQRRKEPLHLIDGN